MIRLMCDSSISYRGALSIGNDGDDPIGRAAVPEGENRVPRKRKMGAAPIQMLGVTYRAT